MPLAMAALSAGATASPSIADTTRASGACGIAFVKVAICSVVSGLSDPMYWKLIPSSLPAFSPPARATSK